MKYEEYKTRLLQNLVKEAKAICPGLQPGVWASTGAVKDHILPLGSGRNSRYSRARAIMGYLSFDVQKALPSLAGLHPCAHHLNSSQLLCMMFFAPLVENVRCGGGLLQKFMHEAFGIEISANAKCRFEYKQDDNGTYVFKVGNKYEYEGTSFDFYIQDGNTEVFFEIKLTEQGFAKAKDDLRHRQKATQYLKLLSGDSGLSIDDFLRRYQIYRNVIRANGPDKYVIFITDGCNPATGAELGYIPVSANVIHKTWQDLRKPYPLELPFQIKALWDGD